MSDARARANHKLYLARIVLDAWRGALQRQDIPASTLAQAFEAGAREHLIGAYGWFLLAICQAESLPPAPPRSCADLPPVPEGKVLPGEINEFRQLEARGWLAELLEATRDDQPRPRQRNNLVFAAPELPGPQQVAAWLEQLETLFGRMGDLLDEC